MQPKLYILCKVLYFISLLKTNEAVKCYACGSLPVAGSTVQQFKDFMGCPEPFDRNKASEAVCNGYCRKTEFRSGDRHLIARGCSPLCYPQDTTDIETTCCNSDFCNSSSKMTGSFVIMAGSFLLTLCAMLLKGKQ